MIHAAHLAEPFAAVILDVSKWGIRVQALRALSPGDHVTVSFADRKEKVIHTEVRFTETNPDGTYAIGLEITDALSGSGEAGSAS